MGQRDVVVIGAGLGGLAAAVALAREGRDVLMLEAHEVAGGYAANFSRAPYRFDVSLHLLDAVGPGQANHALWAYLGLDRRVVTHEPPLLRLERWPDHDLEVGPGLDRWIDAVAKVSPDDRSGMVALAAQCQAVHHAAIDDRDRRLRGASPAPLGPPMDRVLDRTALDVLTDHLADGRARAVAGALSCYLGLGPDELAAIPFLAMVASYHGHGGSYPEGGSGAIAQALVDELEAHGGEVRLESPVAEVTCRYGGVTGVTTAAGEAIEAPAVVANVSPVDLYGRMVPADHVPRRFRARLERMSLGTSVVKVWLGCGVDPAPDLPYEVFLRGNYGTSFADASVDDLTVVCPHREDPGCAPDGGAVISITAGVEPTLDPTDRERHRALAEAAIREVDARLIPGLADAIEVRVVATPSTFHRYTDNPAGTIHGFRPVPAQSGPRRLGVTGPIARLYHVGGWAYAGSGFTPSMTSGLIAAAHLTGGLQDFM